MANEIKVGISLECAKDNFKLPRVGAAIVQVDQTGNGGSAPGMVLVGELGVTLDLSAVEDLGWCYMRNIDEHQTVLFGVWDGGAFRECIKMLPGEPAGMRLIQGVTYRFEVDATTEGSGSTSGQNQAKVQMYVLES
jgi:hypothetical protein